MVNNGLLDDYWRRSRQNRIATGTPMSYNQTLGAVDAGLAHESDLARIASDRAYRNEQLELQKAQMRKADRAATFSGIANVGQLAGNLYLGKGLLDVYNRRLPIPNPVVSPSIGPSGNLIEAGAANGGTMTASSSVPQIPSIAAGNPEAWAPPAFGSPSVASAAPSPLMVGGQAAGLMAAQMTTADLLEKPAEKLGLDYTQKLGKYGGVPGIGVGLPIDLGKKVADLGKELLDFF